VQGTLADPSITGTSSCIDGNQRLLFSEDTVIVAANSISATRDGNILIPGYYYGKGGVTYNMPYLVKCSPEGNIMWSMKYFSTGIFPSQWFSASKIKELNSGNLLMTGQIGIPGTDDRRDLAVWKLSANGTLIWGVSYENATWTNPITGSTEITGIQEDGQGNIYLAGNLRFFELSQYAFVLKLDQKGRLLWDRLFNITSPLTYGVLLLGNRLALIGSLGSDSLATSAGSNLLWCIYIDPDNGNTISTRAWLANFGPKSFPNSFAYPNTSVGLLDNGQISVTGTAISDFLGLVTTNQDTINHSIVANFDQDFGFSGGVMLSSLHQTNYYNTLVTQHPNGRISYTRFVEDNNLFHEGIIYGNVQNNQLKERIYYEPNRSSALLSNFLFFEPDEDFLVQAFRNGSDANGGLEIVRMHDKDSSNICNGSDTVATFMSPYLMSEAQLPIDSTLIGTFRLTRHNFIETQFGNVKRETACTRPGVSIYANPVVSLDKDSVICKGGIKILDAGQNYSQYLWSDGSNNSTLTITKPGTYWVEVTDEHGCQASDTAEVSAIAPSPSGFLAHDTVFCQFSKFTIQPSQSYDQYLWSDLSTGPSLTIDQPGIYRLQVTDSNHCTGTDSILIKEKQCLDDLVVPNAFTPNGDGKNDLFRPVILENLSAYRFAVFDRWGEEVFETEEMLNGWDGTFKGSAAPTGVYVWYCRYQPSGSGEKIKKGTVVLIK
jgi:gliding motility-associated-like protein